MEMESKNSIEFNLDDLDIDDINKNIDKKKKVKSGAKGKRAERAIVDLLNQRFRTYFDNHKDAGEFSRSIGSGNRWGQKVVLSKAAKDTFTGDLTCPTNFKFVIESKNGYNDIDILSCFDGENKGLDAFIKQVCSDSETSDRKPLLIWKKDRKKRIAFVRAGDMNGKTLPPVYFVYGEWIGVDLDYLLTFDDSFFFTL